MLHEGKSVPSGKSKIDVFGKTMKIKKLTAAKDDCGKYTVKLKNEYGEAEETVSLLLLLVG